MLFSQNEMDNIKREMAKLKEKIVLKLFTDFKTHEDGTKLRKCMACEGTHELLKTLEKLSNGKLTIEELSTEENEEEAEKYNVTRIPAILFVDEKSKVVPLHTILCCSIVSICVFPYPLSGQSHSGSFQS